MEQIPSSELAPYNICTFREKDKEKGKMTVTGCYQHFRNQITWANLWRSYDVKSHQLAVKRSCTMRHTVETCGILHSKEENKISMDVELQSFKLESGPLKDSALGHWGAAEESSQNISFDSAEISKYDCRTCLNKQALTIPSQIHQYHVLGLFYLWILWIDDSLF